MNQSFEYAVILDFEATCEEGSRISPQEVIEYPSVLLNVATQELVAEFQSFVRPVHHPTLSEFCRNLTSIRQADVDAAPSFTEVHRDHQGWLDRHGVSEQNAVFVTCGDWDLATMLPGQWAASGLPLDTLRPIYWRWQNIKRTFCKTMRKKKSGGMVAMLRALKLPLVGTHHRGIDDCRNIAQIYRALLERGARPEITKQLTRA